MITIADDIEAIEARLLQLIDKYQRIVDIVFSWASGEIFILPARKTWQVNVGIARRSYTTLKGGCGKLSNIIRTISRPFVWVIQ